MIMLKNRYSQPQREVHLMKQLKIKDTINTFGFTNCFPSTTILWNSSPPMGPLSHL